MRIHIFSGLIFIFTSAVFAANEVEYKVDDLTFVFEPKADGGVKASLYNPTEAALRFMEVESITKHLTLEQIMERKDLNSYKKLEEVLVYMASVIGPRERGSIWETDKKSPQSLSLRIDKLEVKEEVDLSKNAPLNELELFTDAVEIPGTNLKVNKVLATRTCEIYKSKVYGIYTQGWVATCTPWTNLP